MPESDDITLLKQYAQQNSEAAFAALVERYVNLVYSVALRNVGNAHAAEEITQAVFIILARKAKSISPRTILSGWLYQTTRLTAANFLRGEIRRQRREQEAYMQSTLNDSESEAWFQIAPLLDDAISKLGARDRDAIVLRFFENKNLREVGAALGASEDAAKMRVNRALETLRKFFAKRGVVSTTAIIAGAVSANSVQAAPVGLANTISAVAIAKGAAVSGSTLTLVKGALKIMAWTKAKTAIVVGVGVLLAAGTTTVTIKKIVEYKADDSWRVRYFDSRVLDRTSPQVKILPAKFPRGGGCGTINGKRMGIGVNAETVVQMAYGDAWHDRTILCTELPKGKYDFIASLPSGNAEALQQEVKKRFGVVASRETIQTNILLLTVKFPNAHGLKPSRTQYRSSERTSESQFSCVNQSVFYVAGMLEYKLQIPVIDQTGLTQNFDIDLKWNQNDPQHENLKQALLNQLGLELVPGTAPVEFLVVEKAN